jgi:muramoyltetrapeptide carboxypeptidase
MISRRNFIRTASVLSASPLFGNFSPFANLFQEELQAIKAPALKKGDTVAITSPAGAVWDQKQINVFSDVLRSFGFNVVLGQTLKEKFGYFSGTDQFRADELNAMFADNNIKGIFSMKGGWGCARILDKVDYTSIKNNPKVFVGFSDITALLLAITKKTGLITFHGPVGNSGWNDFTRAAFTGVSMNTQAGYFPASPFNEVKPVTISAGEASGRLMGGNLTVLSGLLGSAYLPDWKNKILFLEEAKEEPYSIDRMLTQLKLAGVLDQISGFVFGKCTKCFAEEPEKAFTYEEVLLQHIQPLGIPAFYSALFGHVENKITLPLGVRAKIDASACTIQLLEAAVS